GAEALADGRGSAFLSCRSNKWGEGEETAGSLVALLAAVGEFPEHHRSGAAPHGRALLVELLLAVAADRQHSSVRREGEGPGRHVQRDALLYFSRRQVPQIDPARQLAPLVLFADEPGTEGDRLAVGRQGRGAVNSPLAGDHFPLRQLLEVPDRQVAGVADADQRLAVGREGDKPAVPVRLQAPRG